MRDWYYGVKLALVDAAIRAGTVERGSALFDMIKSRAIRLRPPEHAVVNNTFVKIQRRRELPKRKMNPDEASSAAEDLRRRPYQSTIAYREFCCFMGELDVAMEVSDLSDAEVLEIVSVFAHVNYFGKRGSFMQFLRSRIEGELSRGFTVPVDEWQSRGGGTWGTIQPLDDLGETQDRYLFDRVNTYGARSVELLKHRRLVFTLLTYQLQSSSRGYSHYRRTD
jgi:hypothetical protein